MIVRHLDLPAVAIVSGRLWFAAIALGLVLLQRRRAGDPSPLLPRRRGLAIVSGILLAGHWVALVTALQRAPIGTVLLLTYLSPVGVAALAPRVLGERVGRRTLVALALALGGTAILLGPEGGDGAGVTLALVAGATLCALTLASRALARTYGGARLAFVQFAVAAIVLVPWAATASWGSPDWSWGWLAVLGLVHTGLAASIYLWALGHLEATTTGVLAYLEPASAVLYGWVFLSETPGPAVVAGGLLVVAAGVIVVSGSSALVPVQVIDVPR